MEDTSFYFSGPDKNPLHLLYDDGNQSILARDFWGYDVKIARKDMLKSPKIQFHPSPSEIWNLSSQKREYRQHDQKSVSNPDYFDLLILTVKKLFEFGYLKVDTLGYYMAGKYTNHITKSLALNLASKLAHFAPQTTDLPEIADWHTSCREKLEKWIVKPTKKNWKPFVTLCTARWKEPEFLVDSGTACCVTNKIFKWSFDGRTAKPAYKFISEEDATPEEIQKSKYNNKGEEYRFSRSILRPVTPFPYADGHLPKLELELDCPTGHLIFANSLYNIFDEGDIYQFEINTEQGRQDQANHLHKLGAWHIYNAGHGEIYQKGNSIIVGCWPEYEIEEGKLQDPQQAGWKPIGDVSGQLRWFYACDEGTLPNDWQSKLAHKEEHIVRTVVAPGRYKLTNLLEHQRKNGAFASIEPALAYVN